MGTVAVGRFLFPNSAAGLPGNTSWVGKEGGISPLPLLLPLPLPLSLTEPILCAAQLERVRSSSGVFPTSGSARSCSTLENGGLAEHRGE